ncbi:unnamed protein product [Phytomonas sp. EM1]|nr:unnamed protein product [Phytomonas sp. EM1]|eukprot:CCW60750.1 unnamed protein product [Phytomonas sp. isolate EM1]
MDKHVDPEYSWRVLFEITLSHGEWVRIQRIAYKGFLTFLRSANLLNSQNGVSLLLVEQLWWKHRVMMPPPEITTPNLCMSTDSTKTITQEDYFKSRDEVYSHGLLNFEGFTDIMNVISVRCYQTWKCTQLHKEVGESLQDAIILSSEDNIGLRECISYTAKHYLKSFISRNLVHRNTKMFLDPTRNEWTIQTNRVVSHIVNNLQDTVIIPLFEYYSDNSGEMNREQFERFVKFVFPEFTLVQKASALSIFYCDVDHKERYGWVENLSSDDNTAPLVFGIDSFVDALLMLSVIAFADESHFQHHLSITSKVWSTFERYLCPAITKLSLSNRLQSVNAPSMAADPLFLDRTALAVPYITHMFPTTILVDDISSILIGGINITIDPTYIIPEGSQNDRHGALVKEENQKRSSDKPIFRRVVELLKAPPVSVVFDEEDLTLSKSRNEMKDKVEAAVDRKLAASNSSMSLPELDSFTARAWSALSDTKAIVKVNRNRRKGPQRSLSGMISNDTVGKHATSSFSSKNSVAHASKLYLPYIDDEPSFCREYAPNRVEVLLPESVRNVRLFKLAVVYKEEGENDRNTRKNSASRSYPNRCGYFQFTPVRQLSFSLRHNTGEGILTSKTAVLKATSTCRPVPPAVLSSLREAFFQRAKPINIGSGTLPRGEPCITMSDFEDICCSLRLTPDVTLAAAQCKTAVKEAIHASFLLLEKRLVDSDDDPMRHISQGAWIKVRLGFSQFMEAVAALGLHLQSFSSADSVSDLINFLLLALPTSDLVAGEGRTTPPEADESIVSEFALPSIEPSIKKTGASVLPYNSRLDGPCKNVLHHCRRPSFASRLRDMHQSLKRPPKVLLPGYPEDVLGKDARPVSCRLSPELHTASEVLKNEFLMNEVTITADGSAHIF